MHKSDFDALIKGRVYQEKINTPAADPDYHHKFTKPLITEALGKNPDEKISVLVLPCGHGYEIPHLVQDLDQKNIKIVGMDPAQETLAKSTRSRIGELGKDCLLVAADAARSPLKENSIDVAISINGTMYVPDKMLETMFHALKPGGKCSVNFTLWKNNQKTNRKHLKEKGEVFFEYLEYHDKKFHLAVRDYKNRQDEHLRALWQQRNFLRLFDITRLIELVGFKIIDHEQYQVKTRNGSLNEVFTLGKPTNASS